MAPKAGAPNSLASMDMRQVFDSQAQPRGSAWSPEKAAEEPYADVTQLNPCFLPSPVSTNATGPENKRVGAHQDLRS